jgi:hypothetical protein
MKMCIVFSWLQNGDWFAAVVNAVMNLRIP